MFRDATATEEGNLMESAVVFTSPVSFPKKKGHTESLQGPFISPVCDALNQPVSFLLFQKC
jgi:hypothetical protein